MNSFFLPGESSSVVDGATVKRWYGNLFTEVFEGCYSSCELSLLKDRRNYYGKLFDDKSMVFFLNHFAVNLAESIKHLMMNKKPRILEIGSGCGNQLLLMSLLGAHMVGCDIRSDVCDLVKKRKQLYEKLSGRELNISIICDDVFNIDWDKYGKFDGVNFLFSFNDIKNPYRLMGLVKRLLKPGGRIVLQEANQSNYYNCIFRRRDKLKPKETVAWLKENGFLVCHLDGGYALPPIFWRCFSPEIASRLDRCLTKSLFLSPSYHLIAEKN